MPRLPLLGVVAIALSSRPARASPDGAITGKVLMVANGKQVAIENAWVYVEHEVRPGAKLGEGERATIAQRGQSFIPPILVIPIGATIEFPILDTDEHSVFSPAAGTWFGFELGRYRKGARRERTFSDTGEFDIYCDLHEQMAATVKVIRTRYQAAVPASGEFRLAVPPGRYRVWAWTPHSREVRSELVEVKLGADVAVQELHLQRGVAPATHLRSDGRPYSPYAH